ncbi:hypothetical protein IC582_004139 [Cucumis melo]
MHRFGVLGMLKHSHISTPKMTTCDRNPTKLLIILITFLCFNNIIAKNEWISDATTDQTGKIWALLIAGSNGYDNYRHQVPFLYHFNYTNYT